jgi:O-antigen ligase
MLIVRTAVIVTAGLAIYQFLPGDVTAHFADLSGSGTSASAYNINIRYQYDHDAESLIAAHPWTGVGVGNYMAGQAALGTQTTDPHNVVLLEAAEGGYLFAASFLLLIGGTALVLWRLRRVELASAAAAVMLATFAHGMVDVYWVRGLPVLGFLLVGMVCGLAARRRLEPAL